MYVFTLLCLVAKPVVKFLSMVTELILPAVMVEMIIIGNRLTWMFSEWDVSLFSSGNS